MEKVLNKTVDALARLGERIERRISTDDVDETIYERSGSGSGFPGPGSAFYRPLDQKQHRKSSHGSGRRDGSYGGNGRQYSSDHLAASPAYSSFSNYRQNPRADPFGGQASGSPYGTGIGAPLNNAYNSFPSNPFGSDYGEQNYQSMNGSYGGMPANVGYAPEYYVAERRQVDLVPAPPPRIIQQRVPVPYAVDRPVPQPYPVEVQRPVYIDRPVPYPVATPVPVDRPVPVPYPVAVPSPAPPPVCIPVPVPVPSPVPCYIPVGVPVPSPPPSPIMFEQSMTHTQRWVTGSPAMMNQQHYLAGSPAMGMNPYISYGNGSFIR